MHKRVKRIEEVTYIVLVDGDGRILENRKRIDLGLYCLATRIVARAFHELSRHRILELVSLQVEVTESMDLHREKG